MIDTQVQYTAEQTAENRKKWTAALRSGEFAQGKGQLYEPETDGYCCLGVACELAAREGVVEGRDDDGSYGGPMHTQEGNAYVLPDRVRAWLGLAGVGGDLRTPVEYVGHAEDGEASWEDQANALAGLNDGAGYTFAQLADIIDADGVRLAGEDVDEDQ